MDDFASGYVLGSDSGNGNNNGGFGGMFGEGLWAIIILAMLGFGGRGFGFGGGFGGGGDYGPCATQADVRAAVDQQTLISKLDQQTYGLADSTYALNNAITNGFHGVDNAICNLGYNVQNGFNTIGHQLADCCCATQRAIDSVKYENATNTCAIQNTIQNTTRDVIENQNANSRAILDALNANYIRTLEQENNSLRLSASQSAQNAVLMAAMDANKAEILRKTGAECPTAAYIVQRKRWRNPRLMQHRSDILFLWARHWIIQKSRPWHQGPLLPQPDHRCPTKYEIANHKWPGFSELSRYPCWPLSRLQCWEPEIIVHREEPAYRHRCGLEHYTEQSVFLLFVQ